MENKIRKKANPFLFILLTIGLAVPGIAQQEEKNELNDRINRYQRVYNNGTQTSTATNNANYGRQVRTQRQRANNNAYVHNGRVARRGGYYNNYNYRRNNSRLVYRTRNGYNRAARVYGNPIGFRVRYLPNNAIRFNRGGNLFFYSCGDFYVETAFGYRTIQAPIGARIRVLPYRARAVYYGRDVFYQIDDVLLAAVTNRRGRIVYEVVGYA